jgi:hypothetical protein
LKICLNKSLGGIPANSKIVEVDAVDGKNIFYLPKDSDFTAIMKITDNTQDLNKKIEKIKFNEQMILESIGKANKFFINIYNICNIPLQIIRFFFFCYEGLLN